MNLAVVTLNFTYSENKQYCTATYSFIGNVEICSSIWIIYASSQQPPGIVLSYILIWVKNWGNIPPRHKQSNSLLMGLPLKATIATQTPGSLNEYFR